VRVEENIAGMDKFEGFGVGRVGKEGRKEGGKGKMLLGGNCKKGSERNEVNPREGWKGTCPSSPLPFLGRPKEVKSCFGNQRKSNK